MFSLRVRHIITQRSRRVTGLVTTSVDLKHGKGADKTFMSRDLAFPQQVDALL